MPAMPVAVVRCEPHCPHCGWKLIAPREVDEELQKPACAWIGVTCAGCDWHGHAKFWTHQADEPV